MRYIRFIYEYILPVSKTTAQDFFPYIRRSIDELERCVAFPATIDPFFYAILYLKTALNVKDRRRRKNRLPANQAEVYTERMIQEESNGIQDK